MVKKKDHNKKHYFSMVEAEEFLDNLEFHASKKGICTLWLEGAKEGQAEEFEITEWDSKTRTYTMSSKGSLLKKLTGSKLMNKDVFVKMSLPRHHLFTTSHLKFDEITKDYKMTFKNDFYKGQQRSNYRLKCSRYIKVKFKWNEDENFVYDGLDISAGGTSFKILKEVGLEKFPKEKKLNDCTVALNGRKFHIPEVIVASTWPMQADPQDKENQGKEFLGIGVSFPNLNKSTEEELFLHINTEARGEEVHKKILNKKK